MFINEPATGDEEGGEVQDLEKIPVHQPVQHDIITEGGSSSQMSNHIDDGMDDIDVSEDEEPYGEDERMIRGKVDNNEESTSGGSLREYYILYLYLFLYFLTFGLLNPVAFELFERVYIASNGNSNNATFFFGFLNSLPCLIFFCVSPIVGNLADKYGKKMFLVIFSVLFTSIFTIYLVLSALVSVKDEELYSPLVWMKKNSLGIYTLACVIQGFCLDIVPLTNSLLANYFYHNESNKETGIFGTLSNLFSFVVAIMGLSTTFGSIISALVVKFMNIVTVFQLILLVSLISTTVLVKYLQERVKQPKEQHSNIINQLVFPFKYIFTILIEGDKTLILLIITKLLSTMSSFAFFSIVTQFTRYKYSFTPIENGYLLTLLGLCAILSNSILSKVIMKISKNNERYALLLSSTFTALVSLYFILCPFGDFIYIGMLFLLVGAKEDALRTSLITTIFNKPEEQGTLNGCLGSISIVGRAIAPFLFSFILNESRGRFIDLPFIIILLIQLVGMVLVFKIIRLN